MITKVRIQNYRSFVDAEVKLRPFSLVVGANGSGKTNFLRFLATVSSKSELHHFGPHSLHILGKPYPDEINWVKHCNQKAQGARFTIETTNEVFEATEPINFGRPGLRDRLPWEVPLLPVFNLVPAAISSPETLQTNAVVNKDGSGTVQVLDMLKNGKREDLFDSIEANFKRYVPDVEKLSSIIVGPGQKQIQIFEKHLDTPLPASELSEGVRLILCILTILHQEQPPPIILLEDIDRGLHPRLFEHFSMMMRDIAERHDINIIATTHNPYLVDCFQEDKEAVIIVEKKDGASTLTTLADKLEGIDYDEVDPDDLPLGHLWFSGIVGGVPQIFKKRPKA